MFSKKTTDTLEKMIDVNSPIIYIRDYDFVRCDMLIDSVKTSDKTVIKEWNPATGLTKFANGTKRPQKFFAKCPYASSTESEEDLKNLLKEEASRFLGLETERFLVLKNIHELLNDKKLVTYLQLIAQRRMEEEEFNTTIFIVSSVVNIPEELNEFISLFEPDFPEEDEIKEIIKEHLRVNHYKEDTGLSEDELQKLMPSLKGLTRFQVDRMISMAMSENGTLGAADTELILKQKKTIVKKSGILELIESPSKIEDIGGLEVLKDYLKKEEKVVTNLEKAKKMGVKVPKGIFLVGMPGCGKSLCAKAAAALFDAPLLQLDMGRLQAKYVGESEANLRKAIKTAEAVAPCVLWIDEIEKGFASRNGENDVVMRMFATFLSWLQDKKSAVFIIATANNADNLPPELKRKGRFDEIFCVNLPNREERKSIFKVHVSRFKKTELLCSLDDSEYEELAQKTEGYNGADIESVVNETAKAAFIDGKNKISFEDFSAIIEKTKSISDSCKDQIDKMKKAFKEAHFKSASSEENNDKKGKKTTCRN